MQAPDPVVLREALRQGERILLMQDASRESVLRRAGELLRLSVAGMGGFIIVSGLLASVGVAVGSLSSGVLVLGFALLVTAAGLTALLLSGATLEAEFVFGPDMGRLVSRMRDAGVDEIGILVGLVEALPDSIQDNYLLLRQMRRLGSSSLGALAFGTVLFLMTLVLVVGGTLA